MSMQPQLTLTNYTGNKSHLSQKPLIGHSLTSDSQGLSEEAWYLRPKSHLLYGEDTP